MKIKHPLLLVGLASAAYLFWKYRDTIIYKLSTLGQATAAAPQATTGSQIQ
jgi:hypothetical protein